MIDEFVPYFPYFVVAAILFYVVFRCAIRISSESLSEKLSSKLTIEFKNKIEDLSSKASSEEQKLVKIRQDIAAEKIELAKARKGASDELKRLNDEKAIVEALLEEQEQTHPWLASLIAEYYETFDQKLAQNLLEKTRPAPRAAEDVARLGREKRELMEKLKLTEHQLLMYESRFPELLEFREYSPHEISEAAKAFSSGDVSEKEILLRWLSAEEYAALSYVEKYQLALDRYKRHKRSNWEAGLAYERYVGYLFEAKGYNVQYNGAIARLEDMGRDLIAVRGGTTVIVQCKRYGKDKTVHENTVFQLHGSSVHYQILNPCVKVIPVIYSTAPLSDVARKCAEYLKIVVRDNFPISDYPMIKCNISSSGERIYHLPFDQQYDRVRIIPEHGEKYVSTVEEAENAGFRRAWRWHGTSG